MLQSAGSQRLGTDSAHGPQAITQAMESSEMIKNGGRQPAPVSGGCLTFSGLCKLFLLCTDQDAGWTSLLPLLESAYSSSGPFS